jgi:Eukaryotic porin
MLHGSKLHVINMLLCYRCCKWSSAIISQVAALLEERLNQGVNFLLSGEIDHWKKDYKFGFGLTVGE